MSSATLPLEVPLDLGQGHPVKKTTAGKMDGPKESLTGRSQIKTTVGPESKDGGLAPDGAIVDTVAKREDGNTGVTNLVHGGNTNQVEETL